MKFLQTLLLVILCSCLNCEATSIGNPKLKVAYFVEGSLRGKLSNQPLPGSWDEIEPVVEIRKMDPRGWLFDMRTINSFALVPGAPVIIKEPGISRDYYGKRLFLISRAEETVPSGAAGRCVILIDPEDIGPTALRTYSYFIQEATAQLILGQLKGFDPKKTPVAFEDLPSIEKRFKAEQMEFDDFVNAHPPRPSRRPGTNHPDEGAKATIPASHAIEYAAAILVAGGTVIWLLRKRSAETR